MTYMVVSATNAVDLNYAINRMAEDGWVCIGGMAVSVVLGGERFYQLMGFELKPKAKRRGG